MTFRLRGHRSKTRASYKIALNSRNGTAPSLAEKQFNEYQKSRGMNLIWGCTLPFYDPEKGMTYDFEMDFVHPTDQSYDLDFEVDGEAFHGTERAINKDNWKDRIKNDYSIKVIRVPAVLCQKKWWNYLDAMLPKAVLSKQGSVRIPA